MGERSSAGRRARDSSVANAITGCAPDRGRKESSAPRSPDGRRWTGACAWRRWRRSPPARRKRGSRPACTTANYLGTPLRWIGCQSSRLGRIPRATATTRWHRRDQCRKQPLLLGDGTTLRRHAHRPQALLLPGPGPLANWPARAPPPGRSGSGASSRDSERASRRPVSLGAVSAPWMQKGCTSLNDAAKAKLTHC